MGLKMNSVKCSLFLFCNDKISKNSKDKCERDSENHCSNGFTFVKLPRIYMNNKSYKGNN